MAGGVARGPARPVVYGIVGDGWRAGFFHRLAAAFPDRLRVTSVVTRSQESGDRAEQRWAVPAVRTLREAVAVERPDFVVVSVPWTAAPQLTREAVDLDVPVLTETPPAPDVAGLVDLWSAVGASGLVQVAEQYPQYPGHAARRSLVSGGVLGTVSNVQVSSTHQYHVMALLRGFLGVGFDDAAVTAFRSEFPLASPMSRTGWTGDLSPRPSWNELAHLDFGGGRTGLYDFTDDQWHNELRSNRIVVRGSRGEIVGDHVQDESTVLESDLVRRQTGIDMNFEGHDLDHVSFEGRVVYRNAWSGGRLADDEIAVADVLAQTGDWARGDGPGPYPLAQACQDHLLALTVDEAVATGRTVRTTRQPWAA